MYCNNCGEKGHYSRQCNKPITSYGVLLFTYVKDIPKIIMIQRKDSLCYIELIRGKYNPKNTKLIKLLLSRISNQERNDIITKDFDTLWKSLWLIDNINETKYMKEYNRSKKLFNILKDGYSQNNEMYSIEKYFKDIQYKYIETEWEFPKGKKKIGETFLEAAERELSEELGLKGVVLEEIFCLEASVCTGYEFINVFLCRENSKVSPDPEEIIDWRWCSSEELQSWMEEHPDIFTSVFKNIVTCFRELQVL